MPDLNNTIIPQMPPQPRNRDLRVVDGRAGLPLNPRNISLSITPADPPSTQGRLIPVTYDSMRQGQPSSHRALIPWTTDYDVGLHATSPTIRPYNMINLQTALESAKAAFQRYFPNGSTNRLRWLSARVQVADGNVWADVTPQVFPTTVAGAEVELRLSEEDDSELDVSILPIGHNLDAANSQAYYEIGVITVGESSVGKTMMHQYFTKKESLRQELLAQTQGVVPDFTNRLMTAQGELIKATLWDTGKLINFTCLKYPL
ncbi:hypothetical protein FRC10_008261 [Ceratobasidium sp. 414]|nr:hypothetical protein FRC10_008261 [Ceratobasidium sp. 414]